MGKLVNSDHREHGPRYYGIAGAIMGSLCIILPSLKIILTGYSMSLPLLGGFLLVIYFSGWEGVRYAKMALTLGWEKGDSVIRFNKIATLIGFALLIGAYLLRLEPILPIS